MTSLNLTCSIDIEDPTFGIIHLKAPTKTTVDVSCIEYIFTVDCSGSMSDRCSDGRTKMQHIVQTLRNMILYLVELALPSTTIFITVNAFDYKIYHTVSRTSLTADTAGSILSAVDKLTPRGSTNIEVALQSVVDTINNMTSRPSQICHIFMTDGEATVGSNRIEVLNKILPANQTNVYNAFIGFGLDHDSSLLNGLVQNTSSEYHFIDKLENSGLVYGEILHGGLYKILTGCRIECNGCLVYDYKTNSWTNSLAIGDIVSEANKTWHIRIETAVSVNINGLEATNLAPSDLTFEKYRLRTLQILYKANEYCRVKRDEAVQDTVPSLIVEEEKVDLILDTLKKDISTLYEEIKAKITESDSYESSYKSNVATPSIFASENSVVQNSYKNLCDDLFICHRTLGTRYGQMYCAARHVSQGTQRGYSVRELALNPRRPDMRRYNTPIPRLRRHHYIDDDDEDDDNTVNDSFADHEMSQNLPYLTPQVSTVMREISCRDSQDTVRL